MPKIDWDITWAKSRARPAPEVPNSVGREGSGGRLPSAHLAELATTGSAIFLSTRVRGPQRDVRKQQRVRLSAATLRSLLLSRVGLLFLPEKRNRSAVDPYSLGCYGKRSRILMALSRN